jgi:hypothetical protein
MQQQSVATVIIVGILSILLADLVRAMVIEFWKNREQVLYKNPDLLSILRIERSRIARPTRNPRRKRINS